MHFSHYLLQFLKAQGSATIPGFGIFLLKKSRAVLDAETNRLLPPALEVTFTAGSVEEDSAFVAYLASAKSVSPAEALQETRQQVQFWNGALETKGEVAVEGLGSFYLNDSELLFVGNVAPATAEEFYGLEEIDIKHIKKSRHHTDSKAYRLARTPYWLFPLLLGIAALIYFGITQPETLFGKRSDGLREAVKPREPVAAMPPPVISRDSLTLNQQKSDSLSPAPPPNPTSPK